MSEMRMYIPKTSKLSSYAYAIMILSLNPNNFYRSMLNSFKTFRSFLRRGDHTSRNTPDVIWSAVNIVKYFEIIVVERFEVTFNHTKK